MTDCVAVLCRVGAMKLDGSEGSGEGEGEGEGVVAVVGV